MGQDYPTTPPPTPQWTRHIKKFLKGSCILKAIRGYVYDTVTFSVFHFLKLFIPLSAFQLKWKSGGN